MKINVNMKNMTIKKKKKAVGKYVENFENITARRFKSKLMGI